jgi:eukaryotic-like serine/threonine-protein kinase
MDPAAWQRIAPLVDQALDLPEPDRPAFLAGVGAEDPQLGRELAAFLAGEAEARGFLEGPVDARATALLRAMAEDVRSWDALHREGGRVGPYRVLRELGRGGMGVVFLAERVDGGFQQQVALKLVRRGLDSEDIVARFAAERQILARLQHEHVARLLDGGATEAGQPYYAMEYVEGVPLTVHADRKGLDTAGRLRLFLQVCDAVDYAHRNLVVHRDLKPSNVLVTEGGRVRLLDFGIAKVLEESEPGATVTRGDARPLTPQYAAPEQLRGQPITTATDVYSLGVVLYELLSGRPPHRLDGLSPAEVERTVMEREAPPCSSVAGGALARELRGDLDTIVAVALRKEPGRRYASVGALADDVRRYLSGRPVSARGDRWTYQASKFVRRHRVGVAAAALVSLSLVSGVLATLWQAREALRQARRAEEVKRFTLSLFELSDPDAAKGREVTARQLLERGAQRVETELAGQPDLQAEMWLFLGSIHHRLGLDATGRPLREKALALRRQGPHRDPLAVAEAELAVGSSHMSLGDGVRAVEHLQRALDARVAGLGEDHVQTAVARGLLGQALFQRGDAAGAEPLLRKAVAGLRLHLPAAAPDLAVNLTALGVVRQGEGDLAEAERLYREGLDLRRGAFGEEHTQVASSLFNLAAVMKDRGDLAGAEAQYRQVLALHRRLKESDHEALAADLNNLGTTLIALGRFAEAEALLQESLALRIRVHGADSPRQALGLHSLAQAVRWQGRFEEAEALSRRALGYAVSLVGEDHTNVAAVREELAQTLRERGRLEEAEGLARRALATHRARPQPDPARVALALVTLGRILFVGGRAAEAEGLLEEAVHLRAGKLGDGDWRTAEARLRLGECLEALGRHGEAAGHFASSHAALAAAVGRDHPLTSRAAAALTRAKAPVGS